MSKTIQVCRGANYIRYNNHGLFYLDKNGIEGEVPFYQGPVIRFKPVTLKENGFIQIYVLLASGEKGHSLVG